MVNAGHEIRTEKCSDACQHKVKFALTFSGNDQTLVEICTVALHFCLDICQIKLGFVQVNPKSARKMSNVQLFSANVYKNYGTKVSRVFWFCSA